MGGGATGEDGSRSLRAIGGVEPDLWIAWQRALDREMKCTSMVRSELDHELDLSSRQPRTFYLSFILCRLNSLKKLKNDCTHGKH